MSSEPVDLRAKNDEHAPTYRGSAGPSASVSADGTMLGLPRCYWAARDSKAEDPHPGTSQGRRPTPLICEALAGRYDMSSCDLGWVRKQWLEIRVHELPGPFRRFFLPRFVLEDRG
jgi:hypothetical protein